MGAEAGSPQVHRINNEPPTGEKAQDP